MRSSRVFLAGGAAVLALLILCALILLKVSLGNDLGRPSIGSSDSARELSGRAADIDVETDEVRALEIRGGWTVNIHQGTGGSGLIRIPVESRDALEVRKQSGTLYISLGRVFGIDDSVPCEIDLELAILEELSVDGAADMELRDFTERSLGLKLSGAVNIRGTGLSAESLSISGEGASNIDFSESLFTNVRLDLEGASNIDLQMNGGVLSGRLAGIGSVSYGGSARNELRTEGLASVKKR